MIFFLFLPLQAERRRPHEFCRGPRSDDARNVLAEDEAAAGQVGPERVEVEGRGRRRPPRGDLHGAPQEEEQEALQAGQGPGEVRKAVKNEEKKSSFRYVEREESELFGRKKRTKT